MMNRWTMAVGAALLLVALGCGDDDRKCLEYETRNVLIYQPAIKMNQQIPMKVCVKYEGEDE